MNTVLWIAAGVLLLLLFWQPQDFLSTLRTKSDSNSPSSGGRQPASSKAPSVLKVFALVVIIAYGIAGIGTAWRVVSDANRKEKEERVRQQPTVVTMKPLPPKPEQHFEVTVTPKSETRIYVPFGMTCTTSPVEAGTNNVVWVRWEGQNTRIKDWKERPSGGTKKHRGAHYKYLQAAGKNDVKVEVHIYPTEKDN